MTAILVLATIILFIVVDYLLTRRRQVPARESAASITAAFAPESFDAPAGLFFGPGHTWARVEPDGSATIGIDDFAGKILGRVDRVDIAVHGTELDREDAAFVVHQGEKSAAFAAPLQGVVTSINDEIQRDPGRLQEQPYGSSWLLRVRPKSLSASLSSLRVGEEVQAWMRHEMTRLRDFFAHQQFGGPVGITLHDGGVPVQNVLEHLDREAWERFEEEFLTP